MVKKCKTVAKGAWGKALKAHAGKDAMPADVAEEVEAGTAEKAFLSNGTVPSEAAPEVEVDAGTADEAGAKQDDEVAARSKELKAMAVDELKELVDKLGLDRAKKAEMVEAVLEHEAKVRREQQAHEASVRAVVVEKKEELTSLPVAELRTRCAAAGILGTLSKQERVEHLLTHWQERGGIDHALAKIRRDAREAELNAMGTSALKELCIVAGVDTLVKEVMVDRIVRREAELGKFAPPAPATGEAKVPAPEKKPDLVSAMLANEAARAKQKAEEERQREREATAARKREELRSATVAGLKQQLASKGASTSGTKEDLVEALLALAVEEEARASRWAELRALGKDGLKELLVARGIVAGGGVNEMIEALLRHEAKCEEELRAYEAKVMEQLAAKKRELEAKTGGELKDICVARGLSAGVAIEDRVQRLLRDAKDSGEIDRSIFLAACAARRATLDTIDKAALRKLCDELEVDPLVRPVLVERLMEHEADEEIARPPAKRQRVA